MQISHDRLAIHFNSRFFFLCAIAVLFFPLKWLLGFMVAGVAHEASHYFALRLLGAQIYAIDICESGLTIKTETLSNKQEFLCAMAGPVGGLLIMLVTYRTPYISVCALIQSLYNLLPFGKSDGARILRCLLFRFQKAESVFRFCENIVCIVISALLCFFMLVSANMWIRLLMILMVCRLWHQKYLAKKGNQ